MTTIEIYRNKKREWCWRAKRKGRIVADGGESYKRRASMLKSLHALLCSIQNGACQILENGKEIQIDL
jgi:uncharacterized protein YegP (UPF0339 family)